MFIFKCLGNIQRFLEFKLIIWGCLLKDWESVAVLKASVRITSIFQEDKCHVKNGMKDWWGWSLEVFHLDSIWRLLNFYNSIQACHPFQLTGIWRIWYLNQQHKILTLQDCPEFKLELKFFQILLRDWLKKWYEGMHCRVLMIGLGVWVQNPNARFSL